jgi:hypothetical protein
MQALGFRRGRTLRAPELRADVREFVTGDGGRILLLHATAPGPTMQFENARHEGLRGITLSVVDLPNRLRGSDRTSIEDQPDRHDVLVAPLVHAVHNQVTV